MTDIDIKYAQLGGAGGFLGAAVTPENVAPDGIGRYRHYQGGSIYWTPGTRAHEVHGAIRGKWSGLGWERSFLGYPLTDETRTPDGVGRYNHFQGGSIYWTPGTGAHEVHGAIRGKWSGLGWERSFLGYPLTDETTTPDGVGRYNHFQGGSVYWTPATGAHEVHGAIRGKWSSLGWERSFLGYPLTDETTTPDGVGRYNHFQGGSVYWTPGNRRPRGARRDSRQVVEPRLGAKLPRLPDERRAHHGGRHRALQRVPARLDLLEPWHGCARLPGDRATARQVPDRTDTIQHQPDDREHAPRLRDRPGRREVRLFRGAQPAGVERPRRGLVREWAAPPPSRTSSSAIATSPAANDVVAYFVRSTRAGRTTAAPHIPPGSRGPRSPAERAPGRSVTRSGTSWVCRT